MHLQARRGAAAADDQARAQGPHRWWRDAALEAIDGSATRRVRLRIGILGAARIADEGIIAPTRTLGHPVVGFAGA